MSLVQLLHESSHYYYQCVLATFYREAAQMGGLIFPTDPQDMLAHLFLSKTLLSDDNL